MHIDPFTGVTLAIFLLFAGKGVIGKLPVLRHYSIPESLVGGILGAALVCALYYGSGLEVRFDNSMRDALLLYFFAALGLSSDLRTLLKGGRPFLMLTALAVAFLSLQNAVGMAIAGLFGMDPRAGLMAGSISLTGGVGTTISWTDHFVTELGIANAQELGLAANTIGLIAACVIGGPIATHLMNRHGIKPSGEAELEVGVRHTDADHTQLDYHGVLLAIFWLNCTLMLGQGLMQLLSLSTLKLPDFVGCLIAGIAIRALGDVATPRKRMRLWHFPSMQPSLALISDICLGLFLTMALLGLRLWELEAVLGFITVVMVVQIALAIAFVLLVVFRCMGRDYEAAVMCAGFGGIALGSTATAVANMTAVTREFGGAPKAFVVVPMVCGFSIDLANALIIGLLAR